MRDNRRFQRGSATYKCSICGRQTRETGAGESHSRQCADCYELAAIENSLLDGADYADFREEIERRLASIRTHGGNTTDFDKVFAEIWEGGR